jgi:hypothetical protein
MKRLLILVLAAAAVLSGCAYSFRPKSSASFKTIGIESFENRTAEYGLTDRLTNIMAEAFIKDGTLRVVPVNGAEAILNGTLLRYERQPAQFDITDQVERYKVVLECEVSVRLTATDSVLWSQTLTQEGIYATATETEETGQQRAGDLLVQAILNKTTKSW